MANFNEKKKYHFIYKIINVVTNCYYIGMHSTSNLNDGYLGSGRRIIRSIKKYGRNNFKLEILEHLPNRELLREREKEIINAELINDPKCLNLQIGGISGFDHINILRKNNAEYDKKWRMLQGNRMKEHHKNGKINYATFTNKKHTEETKRLMSIKASKHVGDKNSQFGTCWITKNGINKKIKNSDLPTFTNEGWCKGRVT
jgi:hypothetical protein